MFKLFVVLVILFACQPAYAEETELKTVASILLYETACERTAESQTVLNHLLNKRAHETKTTPSDVFSQAKVMADMLNGMNTDRERVAKYCDDMKSAVTEAAAEQQTGFSGRQLSGRMKLLVEFLILFSLGTAIAFVIGKLYQWRTGVNINASRFWIMGWGFGFIALSRVIVEIMKRAA